ncbi:YdbH domain-containing protein [Kangiella sp.]|uniref:intermembrane phospholipid transport protein YdbH family protein n=1 Tax=Kangiella sp. TaxID=1920245 RepID=UPI00199CC364|nr:YdbH domain-containing protein [Kangiella sp.]MBD3652687.1 YdbH domain-containing protein [Kangiella sp.]
MIKKILKWTAWISAFLALLLLIAYWTSPYWVPGQLAKFLPPSIKLESLDLERPGLTRTKVKQLTLHLEGDSNLNLELHNTELRYSLWQQKLQGISADKAIVRISTSSKAPKESAFQLPDIITIPPLPINQLSIKQLQIKGLAGQSFSLSDIEFTSDNKRIDLSTNAEWMGLTAQIESQILHTEQQVTSLSLNVQQDNNHLTLKAAPAPETSWQLALNGEVQRIPFIQVYSADLGTVVFDMAANIQQIDAEEFQVTLDEASKLEIPLNLNPSWFEQEILSHARELGLSLDSQQLDNHFLLAFDARQQTQLDLNLADKIVKANGLIDLSVTNSNLQSTASIDAVHLDLSTTLFSPQQQASVLLDLSLKLPTTSYQTGDKRFTLTTQSFAANINGSANLVDGNIQLNSQQLDLELANSSLTDSAYHLNLPAHQWQGSIDWQQKLTPPQSELDNTSQAQQANKNFSLQLVKPIDVELALADENINARQLSADVKLANDGVTLNYSANQVSLTKQPLTLYGIKGQLSPSSKDSSLKGAIQFIQASYLSDNIAVDYVSGKFDWRLLDRVFSAKGSLQHSTNTIPARYFYNLKTGAHNLQIDRSSLPMLTLKSWTPLLNAYPALRVTSGDLNIKTLSGDPLKLLFEGDLSINDLSLLYDKLALNNATISDSLNKSSSLQGSVKATIESIELAAGITITNLGFTLKHTATDYRFKNITGQLLGGTIEIPRLDMHKTAIQPFSLLLSGINLQKLLSALESEKLSVSGHFDIILPLVIQPDSRSITNGTFISKQAGILKLKSDGGKDANIAFQALENFHYQELSGTIDYSSEGDYIITLYALGSNPDLYDGFPIKLDLTLRGNLPNLLYSMLVTGDMATPVLDDLKQKDLLKIQ